MMTLVLLPGMDGTGLLLEPFASALSADCTVRIVRYPQTEPLGYAELETIARAALPEEGPFVILGESFSGPLAVSLAATCSSQLKGLILCCSFVRSPRPLLAWLKPFIQVLPVSAAPIAALSYFLLGRSASSPMRAALTQALARISPAALRARLRAVLEVDVSGQLATLNVPILYLRATRDRVVPRAAAETISRLNPRARIVQIDAPHFLLQTAPHDAAQTVADFVRDTPDRRS